MIGAEALFGRQRRRAAALMEPGLAEDDGGARGDEVDGDAGDDLVAALGDRGKAVTRRQARPRRARRKQAEPGGAGDGRDARRTREGGGQHLAFEADVEDPGALGIEAGEAGEQQRHGDADGGVEDVDEDVGRNPWLQTRSPWAAADAGARGLNAAKTTCDRRPEHVLQGAGEQDHRGPG